MYRVPYVNLFLNAFLWRWLAVHLVVIYIYYMHLLRVQEIYNKKLTSLRWSGAHWRKLFSTGENENNYK